MDSVLILYFTNSVNDDDDSDDDDDDDNLKDCEGNNRPYGLN